MSIAVQKSPARRGIEAVVFLRERTGQLAAMIEAGQTNTQIGAAFGVDPVTVGRFARAFFPGRKRQVLIGAAEVERGLYAMTMRIFEALEQRLEARLRTGRPEPELPTEDLEAIAIKIGCRVQKIRRLWRWYRQWRGAGHPDGPMDLAPATAYRCWLLHRLWRRRNQRAAAAGSAALVKAIPGEWQHDG